MFRQSLTMLACALAIGCAAKKEVAKAPPGPAPVADCYTVVLFDEYEIKPPAEGVPPEYARFLGKWERGAWNGQWCHDLLVTEVTPTGKVNLVDMHAPYEPFGAPASAFQRVGRIDKDGNLRLRYGTESVTYRYEDGRLVGERQGIYGTMIAVLRSEGDVPVPLPLARPEDADSGVAVARASKLRAF